MFYLLYCCFSFSKLIQNAVLVFKKNLAYNYGYFVKYDTLDIVPTGGHIIGER